MKIRILTNYCYQKTIREVCCFIFLLLVCGNNFAQEITCDDFTSSDWPLGQNFSQGDTLGISNASNLPIIAGNSTSLSFGASTDQYPGIGFLGQVNFQFDGSSQTAEFEIYGIESQYNQMGFSVNGSTMYYMDAVFPFTINGVTVDLDPTAVDFGNWDNAFLSFTGNLDSVNIELFESGVRSICVIKNIQCDDFTSVDWPLGQSFSQGDTLGISNASNLPIVAGNSTSLSFGASTDQYPGIGFLGQVNFQFDGSSQTAEFEIYGIESQYNQMGFSVNGSTMYYMDAAFPFTINGVTVDLDPTAVDFGNWDNAFLSFTGDLDSVNIELFESGVRSMCVNNNEDLSSIEYILSDDVSVFPNPATEKVTIKNNKDFHSVAVYSTSGKLIFVDNFSSAKKNHLIDLSILSSGIYLLKIDMRDGTRNTSRIIKR